MPTMRAKMKVTDIIKHSETSETLSFRAVSKSEAYPPDGSDENNSFARWTPNAQLSLQITNPDLLGKFQTGQSYYLDFTPAD